LRRELVPAPQLPRELRPSRVRLHGWAAEAEAAEAAVAAGAAPGKPYLPER